MFYSWTDIENLGYKNIEDFAREEKRRQDYEGAVVTPEGIEIIRKQRLSNFECTSPIKKYAQCMLFSKVRLYNHSLLYPTTSILTLYFEMLSFWGIIPETQSTSLFYS